MKYHCLTVTFLVCSSIVFREKFLQQFFTSSAQILAVNLCSQNMSPDGEEVVYISLQYVIYSVWEELQIGQTAHTDLCRLFKAPTMHRELNA